jgi:hypothetical protein
MPLPARARRSKAAAFARVRGKRFGGLLSIGTLTKRKHRARAPRLWMVRRA